MEAKESLKKGASDTERGPGRGGEKFLAISSSFITFEKTVTSSVKKGSHKGIRGEYVARK